MKSALRSIQLLMLLALLSGKLTAAPFLKLSYCAETGDIKGTVKDENHVSVPGAMIIIIGTGEGAVSDEQGDFTIHNINPGTYDVKASAMQKETVTKTGVLIRVNETTYLNFTLSQLTGTIVEVVGKREAYVIPIVNKTFCTFTTIDSKLAESLGTVSINDKITAVCSSCSETNGNQLVMRGARPGTVEYIVDGEKMFGNTEVPNMAVEQITILSGGIPAEYGDLTGGVIIISTKDFISGMRASRIMRSQILENAQ